MIAFVSEIYRLAWPGTSPLYGWRFRTLGGQEMVRTREFFTTFEAAKRDVAEKADRLLEAMGA